MANPHFNRRLLNTFALVALAFLFGIALAQNESVAASDAHPLPPTGLMCELMSHPARTTIFDPQPDFSWIVPLQCRGSKQTAYQIVVAPLSQPTNTMWDSGKTESDQSVAVEYTGKPLTSGQVYTWKVRTWNEKGKPSPWSDPQTFRTGKLRTGNTGSDFESRRTTPLVSTPTERSRSRQNRQEGPRTLVC